MKIKKIWFDDEYLYGLGDNGTTYRQSLIWYQKLRNATEKEQRGICFRFRWHTLA